MTASGPEDLLKHLATPAVAVVAAGAAAACISIRRARREERRRELPPTGSLWIEINNARVHIHTRNRIHPHVRLVPDQRHATVALVVEVGVSILTPSATTTPRTALVQPLETLHLPSPVDVQRQPKPVLARVANRRQRHHRQRRIPRPVALSTPRDSLVEMPLTNGRTSAKRE